MPKNGAHTLSDVPPGMVEIECPKCGRTGRYRRSTLLARFGPDKSLPAMLKDIANCPKRTDTADICQVRFSDVPWNRPASR